MLLVSKPEFWLSDLQNKPLLVIAMYSNGDFYAEIVTLIHTNIIIDLGVRYLI